MTISHRIKNICKIFQNINIDSDLIFYDISLFGDELHLNEKGAEIYSNNLKKKYKL